MKTFQIGRHQSVGLPLKACKLARAEDGGVRLFQGEHPLDSREQHQLFVHFGSALRVMTGGSDEGARWDGMKSVSPGSAEHFLNALHNLPKPFILMGE